VISYRLRWGRQQTGEIGVRLEGVYMFVAGVGSDSSVMDGVERLAPPRTDAISDRSDHEI